MAPEAGRGKGPDSPRGLRRSQPRPHLDLKPQRLILDLQNCKVTKPRCLSSWYLLQQLKGTNTDKFLKIPTHSGRQESTTNNRSCWVLPTHQALLWALDTD